MKILVIARKEFKVVFRETGGLMFMFLMPIAFLLIFNLLLGGMYTGGGDRPFKVPIVNQDRGTLGARIVEQMGTIAWIAVEEQSAAGEKYTEAAAIALVAEGKRNQALIIPPDFSERIGRDEKFALPLYVDPSVAIQYIGPVEGALTGVMFGVLMRERFDEELPRRIEEGMAAMERETGIVIPPFVREKFTGPAVARIFGEQLFSGFSFSDNSLPVSLARTQPPSIKRDEYPTMYQQNLSGYSVLAVFFIVTAIGASFFAERDNGTFRRILAAPVEKFSWLAGKLLPYIFINVLQVAVLVLLSIVLYKTDLGNDPLAFLVVTICLSTSAVGFGLFLVTLFNSPQRMEAVAVVLVLATSSLSGAFVPRFVMGDFVQKASLAVPQSWGVLAYQDIMVRGKGLIDVLPYCGVILLFAAGFFAVALMRYKFE